MRTKLKQVLIAGAAGVIGLAIMSSVAQAQQRPRTERGRKIAQAYIAGLKQCDLSAEQQEKIKALHEKNRESMKLLREQQQTQGRLVKDLVKAPNPDATAVGNAVLKLSDMRANIKSERKKTHAATLALLTPEQKAKFEGYLAGLRTARGFGRGPRG